MRWLRSLTSRQTATFFVVIALARGLNQIKADAPVTAAVAFDTYVATLEARLLRQHGGTTNFFVPTGVDSEAKLRQGELVVEQLSPVDGLPLPGATLYHWRGTAFAHGAQPADFERLMRNFAGYPKCFAPEVSQARVTGGQNDRLQVVMRAKQRHGITVVMDTSYDVTFGRFDPLHGFSISRSTQISEIDGAGTAHEHALSSSQAHGFLWRQNTYWSYEERDGGLYMQIESVSLTRAVPTGLGWAVGPFVQRVPKESLEFTLRAITSAIRR